MILQKLSVVLFIALVFEVNGQAPPTATSLQRVQMTEEASACMDPDLALDSRIEACSELIEAESLSPSLRAQYRLARSSLYIDLANQIRSTGDESRAASLNRASIEDANVLLAFDQEYSATAHFSRGVNYLALEQWDSAIVDFTQSLELEPERHQIYMFRGQALAGAGRIDDAFLDYDQVLDADVPVVFSMTTYFLRVLALCRGDRQHQIDDEIARAADETDYLSTRTLQQILIRQGFYVGRPSWQWTEDSRAALSQWVQADCPFP